ncbi:hypothetical protein H4R34_001998 [Dimargaris verticillata]|uniref:HAD-superfamily hydrolase n=1 Tax=Dimargaris verticillata TaxID=2761393 RepID=A0A9W8B7C2_9FUNG|nr:hypothetical protein H4R34_001998 [Dimargaris verticillata]
MAAFVRSRLGHALPHRPVGWWLKQRRLDGIPLTTAVVGAAGLAPVARAPFLQSPPQHRRLLSSLPLSGQSEVVHLNRYYQQKLASERHRLLHKPLVPLQDFGHPQFIDTMVRPDEVFANAEVQLSRVSVYGFDYDYTLANYTPKLPETIYSMLRDLLIENLGYPSQLRRLQYDPEFAIRGLHYDFETGWLFKMDAFHNIQLDGVHYGREVIKRPEWVIDRHNGKHVAPDYLTKNLHHLNDLFSLPEACLLADVLQYFLDHSIEFHPRYLAEDIRRMAVFLHGGGGIGPGPLHRRIMQDIEQYLEPNAQIVQYLNRLKSHGKKTFLLTNSSFEFVDKGLSVVTGTAEWRDLFDVVIVSSGKPQFYNSRRPFRRIETRFSQPNAPPVWSYVDDLLPGEVYQGGNLHLFSRFTGWSGPRVMYVGDHVFSDLRDPTLQQGWRTGAIIGELGREIQIQNTETYRRHRLWTMRLEQLLNEAQSAVVRMEHYGDEYRDYCTMLDAWRDERKSLRRQSMTPFNCQFGSVFRSHQNPSYFANKVITFADL